MAKKPKGGVTGDVAAVRKASAKIAALLAVNKGHSPALFAQQVREIRSQIGRSMPSMVANALEVLEGKRTWTTAQVQLFNTLLRKVVPDVTHNVTEVHHLEGKRVEELSREELEKLARGEIQPIIDITPDDAESQPAAQMDSEPTNSASN